LSTVNGIKKIDFRDRFTDTRAMDESERREKSDRRQGDRRGKGEDRRKLSLDEIFTDDEIDWSKLGISGDRRKNDRRSGRDKRTGRDRRDESD